MPHRIEALRNEAPVNVALAIAVFIDEGASAMFGADRESAAAPLTSRFTLDEADHFYEILRRSPPALES